MNSIVTQRFAKCHDKLRQDKKIRSSRQFAFALDYLPQSLSEVLKGRRDVTIDLIRRAVEVYRFNPVYLYLGEGPMFLPDNMEQDFRVLTVVTTPDQNERIVHVPTPAQAGYAGEVTNPDFIQELPSYTLPDHKYKSGTHRSFDVVGDSMEPTLYEGDKVVCSYVPPGAWDTDIRNNQVYVIVTRNDIVVKRVLNKLSTAKCLELLSDNESYDMFRVDSADIREVWHIRTRICAFLSSNTQRSNMREQIQELRQLVHNQSLLIKELQATIERMNNAGPSNA